MAKKRTGVFVCHCGNNIAATVDVARVTKEMADEENVVALADDLPPSDGKLGPLAVGQVLPGIAWIEEGDRCIVRQRGHDEIALGPPARRIESPRQQRNSHCGAAAASRATVSCAAGPGMLIFRGG